MMVLCLLFVRKALGLKAMSLARVCFLLMVEGTATVEVSARRSFIVHKALQ